MCQMQHNIPCSMCGKISNPMIEGSGCSCYSHYTSAYVNTICSICGKKNTLTDPCNCNKPFIFSQEIVDNFKEASIYDRPGIITATCGTTDVHTDTHSLKELYDELGKLKWAGADNGWDEAIKAVREHIRAAL